MNTAIATGARTPHLLIIGQARLDTGLGRVLRAIASSVSSRWSVEALGLTSQITEHFPRWTLHACEGEWDVYGEHVLPRIIHQHTPDVVLLLGNLDTIRFHAARIRSLAPQAVVAGYSVTEGRIALPQQVANLGVDLLVAYTEDGRNTILDAHRRLSANASPFPVPLEIIPHGIDLSLFTPLSSSLGVPSPAERAAARRALWGSDTPDADAFIILNANRNHPRKRIDLTISGFAAFAKDKPANVKLFLHTASDHHEFPADFRRLAEAHGIANRIIGLNPGREHPSVSDATLNLIYNACDVGINTSIGEGWGLVTIEHAATGAAQIVPRHSACAELWQGAAEFLEPVGNSWIGASVEGQTVSPEGVATALESLYRNPAYRQQVAARGMAVARRPEYSWDHIGGQWRQAFTQALNARHACAGV